MSGVAACGKGREYMIAFFELLQSRCGGKYGKDIDC